MIEYVVTESIDISPLFDCMTDSSNNKILQRL